MTWNNFLSLRLLFTLGLIAIVASCTLVPETEKTYFYNNGIKVSVDLQNGKIGAIMQENVNAKRLEPIAAQLQLQISQVYPDNFVVLAFPGPVDKTTASLAANELHKLAGKLVKETGLIMTVSGDRTPILISDEFIAKFSPKLSKADIDAMNAANGVVVVGPDHFIKNQYLLRVTNLANVLDVSNKYEQDAGIEFAHPNMWQLEERFDTVLNDPLFPNQWHLRNTGQSGGLVDADSDASWAWDFGLGSSNVLIAVIDDGFDLAHEDLQARVFNNTGEIAGNGIDDDSNGFIDDVNGWDFAPCGGGIPAPGCGDNNPNPSTANDNHGTAVAGVALASGNNALGVSGSCPNCSFLPIRRGYGGFSEQAKANAFAYAQAMGAGIINNSWGHTSTAGVVSTAVTNAINNAATAGVLVVFAAGNGNSAGWCAASYPSLNSVMAVSSTTNNDIKVTAAAFGNCIDIMAPSHRGYNAPYNGTLNVTTTDRTANPGYNIANPPSLTCPLAEPGTNYTHCFGGTSSAAPLSAGIAGLILSADNTLNGQQVQRLIQDTADKVIHSTAAYNPVNGFSTPGGGNAIYAWGRINAFEAVRVATPTLNSGKGKVDLFLRDNLLDWGNTSGYMGQQSSNVLFESPRGFIGHWRSQDIKVDRPPYQPAPTAATFDAFMDETPSAIAGDVNLVYVRVRNRGPVSSGAVNIKLQWTQFGTALPNLPADYWTAYPNNSADPMNPWQAMNCSGAADPYCTIASVPYSGSSVAGTAADGAQIVQFDFPAPPVDATKPNHFCLLAVADSASDPVDPISESIFVVDTITPNDNNVSHRNYKDLPSGDGGSFAERFFVRNPLDEPVIVVLTLENLDILQKGIKFDLDRFKLGERISLKAREEILVTALIGVEAGTEGQIHLSQTRVDSKRPQAMGGLSFGLNPRIKR